MKIVVLGVVVERVDYHGAPETFTVDLFSRTGKIGTVDVSAPPVEGSFGNRFHDAPPIGSNMSVTLETE